MVAAAAGCKEQRTVYADAEYVMFADTSRVQMIPQHETTFTVPVASTVACNYDRNFGVEVIDSKSTAIENRHYRLESNTVTIKAGERVANLVVKADYDALEAADTVKIALRLVLPERVTWDLYGSETNVKLVKSCPFNLDDFTGWCMITSTFLYYYPGENPYMQRLILTQRHPTEENTVILKNFLYDGYDINIKFDPSDYANPRVTMDDGQLLSDERSVFGQINGDDHIWASASPYYTSYFSTCENFVSLYMYVYVEDLGDIIGVVDPYAYTLLEWVSDEEADRLEREEGLTKKG